MEDPPLGVSGLGGWLVLIQIGLYISIIARFVTMIQSLSMLSSSGTGSILTSPDSPYYHPIWKTAFIFEGVSSVIMLLFTIIILTSFYQKKLILPRLMIIFYSVNFLLLLITILMLNEIPLAKEVQGANSISTLIGGILGCAVWIPYFIRSERVKNTFRN
ncbi:DUF2569 domain-containing protein [Paenibacillus bouchesdurhonensis]|uniref:DUF2569 domain-containing protein n=1 Tax=Paenibacillus bouchesdurhonensis TaxID=1870990 RepID=UPI000FB66164|nr:DUF2569 domain-containing protein [Paenibacillus bouchesdurhonensis]